MVQIGQSQRGEKNNQNPVPAAQNNLDNLSKSYFGLTGCGIRLFRSTLALLFNRHKVISWSLFFEICVDVGPWVHNTYNTGKFCETEASLWKDDGVVWLQGNE